MHSKSEEDTFRLPTSGLAEDILPGTDVSVNVSGRAVLEETSEGSGRIYTFADSMKNNGNGGSEQARTAQLETWVTFFLAGEYFALPVHNVREILRAGTITSVPHAPNPVRGVTNMRGRVLPVVDLRLRLGIEKTAVGPVSRILVVESLGRLIGFLVDSVRQVIRMDRNVMQPPPPDVMTNQSDYILGVYRLREDLIILLDVDKILTIKDSLQQMAAGVK